jgi:hypothetical protein
MTSMVMASICGLMVANMWDSGCIISYMVKENSHGKIRKNILELTIKGRKKEMGNNTGQMEGNTLVSLKMVKCMA